MCCGACKLGNTSEGPQVSWPSALFQTLQSYIMDGKMSWIVNDAVDHKGNPADRSKTGGWVPAALILVIEVCERLSTMGIAVNLVTYLVGSMNLPSAKSANIVTDFLGTSYLLCLLGGFLADSLLGRYLTIAIFAVINSLGTGLLSVSTKLPQLRPPPCDSSKSGHCVRANEFQMGFFYTSLYLIALGIGGLKSSVSGFGTDQFDSSDAKESIKMAFFFNRFVFFISTGTLLAVTVLVYIQDQVSRSWAYGICCITMLTALVVFLSGTKRYRYKKRAGSPIIQILQVIVASVKKRRLSYPPNTSFLYEDLPDSSRIHHTDQFCFLDKAAVRDEQDNKAINGDTLSTNPWRLCSITRVEEVKMMIRLLPVWATTIIFWTIYAQMITFSVEQATTMKRTIGSFQIPAGSLTVFFVGAILITLAFYDRVIMPFWRRWKGQPGFTSLQKMGIGLAFSVIGMVAAALVEKERLSVARSLAAHRGSTLPISVFTLIPQFFMIGSGEAFIYTGQLDFFITRSPKGMKTMSTGLFMTTLALGFFLSSFLVSTVKSMTGWLADDINEGRLDCFYGLLAVLSAVNLGAYILCAAWSKPMNSNDELQMSNVVDEKC